MQSFAWAVNFAVICNWFPRKGRGVLIGIWATNTSVGDIVGDQIYNTFRSSNQGYTFIVLGAIVEVVGLLNLFCLTEHPETKNIVITEKSTTSEPEAEAT